MVTWLQKIRDALINPKKGFEKVVSDAKFLWMMLFVIASKLILLLVRYDIFSEYCRIRTETFLRSSNRLLGTELSELQIAKLVDEAALKSFISTCISSVIFFFLTGLVIFMLVFMNKGKGRLKQIYAVLAYAHLPLVISYLIIGILSLFTKNLYFDSFYTSIGFYAGDNLHPFIIGLLSGIELFSLWEFVLIYIGLSELTGLKKSRNITICVVIYVFLLLISGLNVWMGALFG